MPRRPRSIRLSREIRRQLHRRKRALDAVRAAKQARASGKPFKSLEEIAREFDITRQTLHAWSRAAAQAGGEPAAPRRAGRPARWTGRHEEVMRDLHLHLLSQAPTERTTAALIGWFQTRTGVLYAASSLRRMLWRLDCTFTATDGADGVWKARHPLAALTSLTRPTQSAVSRTTIPEWMTEPRQRRIREIVRRNFSARTGESVFVHTVLEQLGTMAREMKSAGATVDDLRAILPLMGIAVEPDSGKLREIESDVAAR